MNGERLGPPAAAYRLWSLGLAYRSVRSTMHKYAKAIKRILMAVNDLEEFSAITGRAYRRRKRSSVEENSIRGAEFLE